MRSQPPNAADGDPASYSLVLQNRPDEIARLGDWLNRLAGQLGLSPQLTFRLDLVLAETVTNIVEHGYDDEAAHDITVTVQLQNKTATVQVIDDGRPFNPLQHPEAALPTSLEEAGQGGLGIRLMRRYTAARQYQREDDKNILTMIVNDPTEIKS